MSTINKYPNLKKIVEEMGFDQGAPKGFFFNGFDLALNGKSESEVVYDADRLEATAKISVEGSLGDLVTLEELREADPAADYKESELAGPFWQQLAAGSGEVNDVIRSKGEDWEYLLNFLDDVFQTDMMQGGVMLFAERGEGNNTCIFINQFDSLAAAAKESERLDSEGQWPEGYDVVAVTDEGKRFTYVDGWVPMEE